MLKKIKVRASSADSILLECLWPVYPSFCLTLPDPRVFQGGDVNTWHCFPSSAQEMHHSSLWGTVLLLLQEMCKNN